MPKPQFPSPALHQLYPADTYDVRHWKHCDATLEAILASTLSDPDVVITCEYKDPNTLWLQRGTYMIARWIAQLSQPSDRWQTTPIQPHLVVQHYRSM